MIDQLALGIKGAEARSPVFARHETFHPRHGWLKKGFDEAVADAEIFLRDDAHVRLGVGKNMVRSIRYWCHAFGVLQFDEDAPGRSKPSELTPFGVDLLSDEGWDPFLEDLGSLWLLHWRLLQLGDATGWEYAFFHHPRLDVSVEDLVKGFQQLLKREYANAKVASSSLKKDALCMLRMYGGPAGHNVSEETIHCPFADLGLLGQGENSKTFSFRMGAKPGLTPDVIAATSLAYASTVTDGETIALSRLLHGPRSPGLAFKLTDSSLYHALELVADRERGLTISDTAGVVQLSFPREWQALYADILGHHYRSDFNRRDAA